MITSSDNNKVKQVKKLLSKSRYRRESGLFVTEGEKIAAEIPPETISDIFVSESYDSRINDSSDDHSRIREFLKNSSEYEIVSDKVFKDMCDTDHPQGILAIVRQPEYELKSLLGTEMRPALLLVLEDIQDPGNLGTMFMTAEGAGATGIIMSRGTVYLFSPKVVRSTMGSIFRMPFYKADDLAVTINQLKKDGISFYAAHLKGIDFYDDISYKGPSAFMIGNEGNGLTDETASLADDYIRIPMGGRLESLNAAMASGILLYEAFRQRRHGFTIG